MTAPTQSAPSNEVMVATLLQAAKERKVHDIPGLQTLLKDAAAALSETAPQVVWEVSNKTSSVLFATQEQAKAYVSQFGAATGGGMFITNRDVLGAPSAQPCVVERKFDCHLIQEKPPYHWNKCAKWCGDDRCPQDERRIDERRHERS